MVELQEEYSQKKINEKELKEIISGWFGYLKEADTYNLRKDTLLHFKSLNPVLYSSLAGQSWSGTTKLNKNI